MPLKIKNIFQKYNFCVKSKKNEIRLLKNICNPIFITALFTIAVIWKQLNANQWMNKAKVADTHNGLLFDFIKEGHLAMCNNKTNP